MLKKIVRFVWQILPRYVRARIVRTTQKKFTVSAAAVIRNEKGEVLLLDHVLRPYSSWGLPGGFLGYGEQAEDAIRREVREETGVEIDCLRQFRVRTLGSHIEILFVGKGVGEAKVLSREIVQLGWFAADGLPETMGYNQKTIIRKVLNGEV